MRISVQCDSHFRANGLFSSHPGLNRDNCLEPYHRLRDEALLRGHSIGTYDVIDSSQADVVIEIDGYHHDDPACRRGVSYLIALESPIVRPDTATPEFRTRFHKVFSWRRGDSEAMVPIPIPLAIQPRTSGLPFHQRRLLCLISSNKTSSAPSSLYRERVRVARWYEARGRQDWGLYGMGWEQGEPLFPAALERGPFRRLGSWRRPFVSFQGAPRTKSEVYSTYRFALAYENCIGFKGYVTEKIFDPMFSGCIPIYRGAPDISRFVPADCFIDGNAFDTPSALDRHLRSIDERRFASFQDAIARFLSGPDLDPLRCERFARTVIDVVEAGQSSPTSASGSGP